MTAIRTMASDLDSGGVQAATCPRTTYPKLILAGVRRRRIRDHWQGCHLTLVARLVAVSELEDALILAHSPAMLDHARLVLT